MHHLRRLFIILFNPTFRFELFCAALKKISEASIDSCPIGRGWEVRYKKPKSSGVGDL